MDDRNVPNTKVNLCKEIFRKNVRSANWLFLTMYNKVLYKKEKKREVLKMNFFSLMQKSEKIQRTQSLLSVKGKLYVRLSL